MKKKKKIKRKKKKKKKRKEIRLRIKQGPFTRNFLPLSHVAKENIITLSNILII